MPMREFLNSEGTPHPEEDRQGIEKFFGEVAAAKEKDPRLESVLDRIKFGTLREIFAEHVRKCGFDPAEMNFIPRERISADTPPDAMALWKSLENTIGIMPPRPYFGVEYDVLHSLSHEETHAISHSEEILDLLEDPTTPGHRDIERVSAQTGYHRLEEPDLFRYFNEGVVERFSQQITAEYLERDRAFGPRDDGRAYVDSFSRRSSYFKYVRLVEALTEKLATEIGVSEETVWQGFIRGLMEGDELDSPQLKAEFDSIFKEGFVDKLKTAASAEDYADLRLMIDGPKLKWVMFKILGMEAKLVKKLGAGTSSIDSALEKAARKFSTRDPRGQLD